MDPVVEVEKVKDEEELEGAAILYTTENPISYWYQQTFIFL